MRKIINTLVGLVILGSVGCVDVSNHPQKTEQVVKQEKPDLEKILKSTYKLRRTVDYIDGVEFSGVNLKFNKVRLVSYGSIFAFARDENTTYFGTAAHCLYTSLDQELTSYFGGFVTSGKSVLKVSISLIDYSHGEEKEIAHLNEFAQDTVSDTAILTCLDLDPEKFPIYNLFLDRDLLKQGDEVYSVGFAHSIINGRSCSWGKQLTRGIISAVDFKDSQIGNEDLIFSEAALDSGMSGGPCFQVENNDPQIIGVNSGCYLNLRKKFGISTGLLKLIERKGLSKLIVANKKD